MFSFLRAFYRIFLKDVGYVLDLAENKEIKELELEDYQTLLDAAIHAQVESSHQFERGFIKGDLMVSFGSRCNSIVIRHRNYRNGGFRIRIKRGK